MGTAFAISNPADVVFWGVMMLPVPLQTQDRYKQAYRELRQSLLNHKVFERSSRGFWFDFIPATLILALGLYHLPTLGPILGGLLVGFIFHKYGVLGHDVSHGYFFKSNRVNKFWSFLFLDVLVGGGSYYWDLFHNRTHHIHTFSVGRDLDIQTVGGAFSPVKTWSEKIMKYQHVYYWMVFPLVVPAFLWDSTETILKNLKGWAKFWAFAKKSTFLIWPAFLISQLGLADGLICFGFQLATTGFFIHFIFMPNHFGLKPFTAEEEKGMPWLERQLRSSRNLAGGPLTFWFYGGLNCQVEHHVFPAVPRHHWPLVSQELKKVCEKYELPYYEVTPLQGYREIYRCLKYGEYVEVG